MQDQPLEILHTDDGEIIDMNKEKTTAAIKQTPQKKEKRNPFCFSLFSFFKHKK